MRLEGKREPRTLVERAASDAVDCAVDVLEGAGAKDVTMFVVLSAKGVPDGERNATLTGEGYADEEELLAALVGHTVECADSMGIELEITVKP